MNQEMKTEKEKKLIKALEETLWMANRYSSGRLSYAPSMFKDAFNSIRDLLNPIEIKRIEEDKVIEEIRKDVEEERKELKEVGKAEAIKRIDNLTEDDWENLIQLDSLDEIKAELKSKIGELAILRRTRKMTELKTLKDLERINVWEGFEGHIEVNELKAEIVKWIKLKDKLIAEKKSIEDLGKIEFESIMAIPWIKYFFNITEEDLK